MKVVEASGRKTWPWRWSAALVHHHEKWKTHAPMPWEITTTSGFLTALLVARSP